MSESEFIEIYINASKEIKAQIEETLNSFETQPASREKDSHILPIIP